jgi:HEAT repeat protein
MKIKRLLVIILSLLMLAPAAFSQDKRTMETKIADLLAQLPANDIQYTDKLMEDLLLLGEEVMVRICNQIIPPGTGDDTKPRFAVESLSRYLSQKGREKDRALWEDICISQVSGKSDYLVKDFFMKQLQLIGGEKSIEALKSYTTDKEICTSAVAAITGIGGKTAENVLAGLLQNKELPCAAAVMNALAAMNSQIAVNEYIFWTSDKNNDIKASAYNALARSGSPQAYPVLLGAVKNNQYRWESTEATSSILTYAQCLGEKGDMKTMDRICKLIIKKCNDELTYQNKTAALDIYVRFHGKDAMSYILKAAAHPDPGFRNAAISMTTGIPGDEITEKWLNYFPRAIPAAKPEIISMLSKRGDVRALPLIKASLNYNDPAVRRSAALALIKIGDNETVPLITGYMMEFNTPSDQEAALTVLKSVARKKDMPLIKDVLANGSPAAKKTAIELIAYKKEASLFKEIMSYTSSPDGKVRKAAFSALASLADKEDQDELINLLIKTEDDAYIDDIQSALAEAACQVTNPEKRSEVILQALASGEDRKKFIPVLAATGGRNALAFVLKEFENGTKEIREVCFNTLTSWKDYSASSALYEICASGNKTYEEPSFKGYVRQVRSASVPDEQKLLLFRKIMPYALTSERKNEILDQIGRLRTYQSLFFVANYLDDPSTASVAARAAMNIALPSSGEKNGMYGTNVKEILKKVMSVLTDQEGEYDREMIRKYLETMPSGEGFVAMFNGKDLTGWQGLVENPIARAKMKPADLALKQVEADRKVPGNWTVRDGCIWFNGSGDNLCSVKEYGDFEMLVDWKISKGGDSGIYLRGSPQVQIWDTSRVQVGAQVGSGGLYNNEKNPAKPLKVADNPVGDWNTFRIIMTGDKVSVWLNGELVVDNVTMENYWDRSIPIFHEGPIELQAHGTDLGFRDIYVREISEQEYNITSEEKSEGFVSLFNGKNLDNWTGDKTAYVVEDGMIVIKPDKGGGGNLYTQNEYSDFIFRFEFQLTPAANNGLGIRAPLQGDAAYMGMEIQILDNTAPVYATLQPYQYHGSVYGVIPARRGYLNPVSEWNYEEVYAKGTRIRVILNGTVIVDGDIADARDNGTMDHREHPGLKNISGHIGFLGHGSIVKFRNIRIKDISDNQH